ncbi:putative cp4-like integrase protein, partial [Novosphingobium sp. Rr 2-17]|uniref:tyrosine-type recombinase/integrase n=1 Tax=Novosphingobium sp. Rr 2-17 TaxID=555793 RepID=UPI000269ABAC
DYKLADGGGLHLLVRPNGSKLWRMKYRFAGNEKLLWFGHHPEVSLTAAGLSRAEAKIALGQGRDPGARAVAKPKMTFEAAARAWHENRLASLDTGHAARLLRRLERDAFAAFGDRDLLAITSADVLAMIRVVEARGALDVSRRLKQHVSQIYRFAIPHGWADQDPTAYLSDLLKPKPRVRHMARVGIDELPDVVRAIDTYDGDQNPRRRAVSRAAMLFTVLIWARTNETRFATWDQFEDLDSAKPLWRVPPGRMKMDRDHLVPLSRQAVRVLNAIGEIARTGYVFPGEKPGKPISQNTISHIHNAL